MIAVIPPPPRTLARATIEALVARYEITMIHVAHHHADAARGICPGRGHSDAERMTAAAVEAASPRPVLCLVLPGARAPRGTGAVVLHVTPRGELR